MFESFPQSRWHQKHMSVCLVLVLPTCIVFKHCTTLEGGNTYSVSRKSRGGDTDRIFRAAGPVMLKVLGETRWNNNNPNTINKQKHYWMLTTLKRPCIELHSVSNPPESSIGLQLTLYTHTHTHTHTNNNNNSPDTAPAPLDCGTPNHKHITIRLYNKLYRGFQVGWQILNHDHTLYIVCFFLLVVMVDCTSTSANQPEILCTCWIVTGSWLQQGSSPPYVWVCGCGRVCSVISVISGHTYTLHIE